MRECPSRGIRPRVARIIWRILYLRRCCGSRARIALNEIDVTEAFRQDNVLWAVGSVFGYGLRERRSCSTVGCSLGGVIRRGSSVRFRQLSSTPIATRRTTTPSLWGRRAPRRRMSRSPRREQPIGLPPCHLVVGFPVEKGG